MEVKIIERFTSKLVLAIRDCVRSVADECVANGLIPGGVRDDMLESTVVSEDKTRMLLKAVKNTTEVDSISFDIFLRILKEKLPERSSAKLLMDMRAELAIEQAQDNECAAMVPTGTLALYHDRGQISVPRAADVSRLLSQEQSPYIGKLEESIREHERTVAEMELLREENEKLKAMSEAETSQLKEKVGKLEEESNRLRMAIGRYRSAIDMKGEEIANQLIAAYEKRFRDFEYSMSRERDDSYSEKESDYDEPKKQKIKDGTDIASNDATWNLRGVEVCGEMTVVVYSSHSQQITWSGYGLRLNIPKGCLPAGMEQCTINIKASLAGQYEFPENSHPVSAAFWLRSEEVHKFTRPITVEIQHCAKPENLSNLQIVRAVCSQKQLPYTFKPLGGNFTSYSSYGVIELDGFSCLATVQSGSAKRQYYSKIFFLNNYLGGHRIDLIVTWDTEAHLTVVKRHYRKQRALAGPDQPIDFESEEIRLDLPMEGTKINDRWIILPLIEPVVTKDEVDSYLPGKRIPHCELAAHPLGEPVTRLVHRLDLCGAKPPRNKFTLSYMPPIASTIGSPRTSSTRESTKPKLKDLQKELSTVANEWENIGIQLEIEEGQLKRIKSDNAGDCIACLREMLRVWLSRVAPPPSWSAMADAVDTLGCEDIATHLRTTYYQ